MKRVAILLIATLFLCGCSANTVPAGDNSIEATSLPVAVETTPLVAVETTPSVEPVFNFDDFKDKVAACVELIESESINLSNMANYEQSYWKSIENLNGTLKPDKMLKEAQDWLMDKTEISVDMMTESHDGICDTYRDIAFTEIEGIEAETVKAKFVELFETYNSLHLSVHEPFGDRNTFVVNINKYIDSIKNAIASLDILLG